jgi:rhodanese-related sulfurtransferase
VATSMSAFEARDDAPVPFGDGLAPVVELHRKRAPLSLAEMIDRARGRIRNLSADEVAAELEGAGAVLVDVREPTETAHGTIPGALLVPRGMLEFHADPTSAYHLAPLHPDRPVIVYCRSGARSALAAATLASMGYSDVAHLDGGITAWADSLRPTARPARQ